MLMSQIFTVNNRPTNGAELLQVLRDTVDQLDERISKEKQGALSRIENATSGLDVDETTDRLVELLVTRKILCSQATSLGKVGDEINSNNVRGTGKSTLEMAQVMWTNDLVHHSTRIDRRDRVRDFATLRVYAELVRLVGPTYY